MENFNILNENEIAALEEGLAEIVPSCMEDYEIEEIVEAARIAQALEFDWWM